MKKFYFLEKKVYDPVHGFIRFDENEKFFIDSFVFQRLRDIKQLGGAFFVFPGATHSRLEHSLGVLELATRMYKKICSNIRPDLFNFIPRENSKEYIYWKKVLRLAALCHDLGHLPFSHVAEKDLLKRGGHEKYTLDIIKSSYLKEVWEKIEKNLIFYIKELKRDFIEDIIKISIGEKILKRINLKKKYNFTNWEKILSNIISGDFFGADRIDYILRDSKFTGISYGLFDYLQLIEMVRVLPVEKNKFDLGIDENGIESCEALIFARHFMYKRVYQNPSVLAYNFHIKRFMSLYYKDRGAIKNIDEYILENDSKIMNEIYAAYLDKNHIGHFDAKKIIGRKKRFKAIELPPHIKKENLEKFKKDNRIEDKDISWEFYNKKNVFNFSFPISKDLNVSFFEKPSFILTTSKNNWVFISPEYEILLIQSLL